MEQTQLNSVTLRGIVGSVKVSEFSDSKVTKITVATNLAYLSKDKTPVIETTWHNCTAWEGKSVSLDGLQKGSKVEIHGRIRNSRFTDAEGQERTYTEIVVKSLELLDTESLPFQQ